MPVSPTKYIKRWTEFVDRSDISLVPPNTRGIYVLLKKRPRLNKYDVVYIGMASGPRAGACGRLKSHAKHKRGLWTHFSVFEVWDNVTVDEIKELEGLFRQIYRLDTRANKLNKQKRSKLLKKVRINNLEGWHDK